VVVNVRITLLRLKCKIFRHKASFYTKREKKGSLIFNIYDVLKLKNLIIWVSQYKAGIGSIFDLASPIRVYVVNFDMI
jgi:hypothetical protein